MGAKKISNIVFDIGNVLCTWTFPKTTAITPKLLKEFRSSLIWYDYNCGLIGEEECYSQLASEFSVSAADIAEAFSLARESLVVNEEMLSTIRELKAAHKGSLRIFAMSNISRPDWEFIQSKPFDWSVFDRVFTSSEAGMSKPELRFYNHVLTEIYAPPDTVLFIDDDSENILAARSLGICSLEFDNNANISRQLANLSGDPVSRGNEFLWRNAGNLNSMTNTGHEVRDNFAQLLILECTGELNHIKLEYHQRTWGYFIGSPFGTTAQHPDDVDTTSLALMMLSIDKEVAHSVMDEMLSLRNVDNIVMTYFDNTRLRIDPVVCVNVTRLFYRYGRGNQPELQATKDWIFNVLFYRGYLDGTRYYSSPEVFLFFFSRLLGDNHSSDIYMRCAALLRERLQERINMPGDAMELAMRVLACHSLGIRNTSDLNRLMALQQLDGGWEIGWLCRYGRTKMELGNRGLTTALAINAVQALKVPSAMRPRAMSDEAISLVSRESSPLDI